MIEMKFQNKTDFGRVAKAVSKANYRSFGHAAASIRKQAMALLKPQVGGRPSPAGSPPRTRYGRLKRSILYAISPSKQWAVIGPDYGKIRDVAAAFEHDGTTTFRGQKYPSRRFMKPALEKMLERIPRAWESSVQ